MNTKRMTLGDAIKKRRKELGMTQKEVAQKACIDPVTVSVFERNARKISLDIFLSIVYALDMQVELTSIDGDEKE